MVEFSLATAANFIDEDDELDEEPGEVIESAPPLKVGEEREIRCGNGTSLKKKLLKCGNGWETPELGDEVTGNPTSFIVSKFLAKFYLSPSLSLLSQSVWLSCSSLRR